jgi:hypothetical protein
MQTGTRQLTVVSAAGTTYDVRRTTSRSLVDSDLLRSTFYPLLELEGQV